MWWRFCQQGTKICSRTPRRGNPRRSANRTRRFVLRCPRTRDEGRRGLPLPRVEASGPEREGRSDPGRRGATPRARTRHRRRVPRGACALSRARATDAVRGIRALIVFSRRRIVWKTPEPNPPRGLASRAVSAAFSRSAKPKKRLRRAFCQTRSRSHARAVRPHARLASASPRPVCPRPRARADSRAPTHAPRHPSPRDRPRAASRG